MRLAEPITTRVWFWCLDRIPMWLRSRWPLTRYYWQQDEIDRIKADAADMARKWRDA